MNQHAKFGRRGGRSTSAKKRNAVRRNGQLGGRPKNPDIAWIMRSFGVSRARAYQLLKEVV